jgi:hypothetical protein
MEKYIKYKRFAETHNEKTIQDFYDKLVTDGWEIIYYSEFRNASGAMSNSPDEKLIHVVLVAGKRQENTLPKVL